MGFFGDLFASFRKVGDFSGEETLKASYADVLSVVQKKYGILSGFKKDSQSVGDGVTDVTYGCEGNTYYEYHNYHIEAIDSNTTAIDISVQSSKNAELSYKGIINYLHKKLGL